MRFFKFPVFFLFIYFLLIPFFSFSSNSCEDGFRSPHSKLHFSNRVVKSGLIEESRRLFPSFVDPVKERNLVKKWNEEAEAPDLLKTLLPEGVFFIKHQQLQPGTLTTVKLGQLKEEVMVRAKYHFEGRELHTNVVFSRRALQSNMKTEKNWLVGEDAKAAFVFIHGGGTASTGSHVAAGMVTHLKKFKVDMVSLDMGWHAQGHREFLNFESEIKALAAFVQKYIPPNVPVFVGGHSWGGVFAEKLMTMTDRPREEFFFHENLKATLIFSTAVDSAPGRSFEEKNTEYHRRLDEVNYHRQSEATPAEVNMWKQIVKDGKFSILGGWYASGTIFQLDHSLPAHRGKKYIPAYVVVGKYDPLVYIGFEDLYNKRYRSLDNVVYTVLDYLPSRYTKKGEPLQLIKVGHLLGEYTTKDGKQSNVQYALTREYIELELKKSAVKEMKQLIAGSLSALDVQARESILKDVEPISSLEELSLFIYTNKAIQNLNPSSLDFLKKSIVEKTDQSSLVVLNTIGEPIKNLIRQQVVLSSLSGANKQDVAESVNNISTVEQLRNFMDGRFVVSNQSTKSKGISRSHSIKGRNESKNKSIKMFIQEQNPMFLEAINEIIQKRLEQYRSSADMSIVDTVQYFANDLAFREYQKDYIHYEYSGNAGVITTRNSNILLEIGNIVEPYYNPQARAIKVLKQVRDINRITNERWNELIEELGYIISDQNINRMNRQGGNELMSLTEEMRTSTLNPSLSDLSLKADNIMNMRTARGDLIFQNIERAEGHWSKRTKKFMGKVKNGSEKEVSRLIDEMGLSAADRERLDFLLKEFYFNNHIINGYFLFKEEDLLKETSVDKREAVIRHYRNLQRINAEWKDIERQRKYYSNDVMEVALFQMHERLFQKIEGYIKVIREALSMKVPISPPDSVKKDQEKLDDISEEMVSAADKLLHIFDNKAVQIFQRQKINSQEVDNILNKGTGDAVLQFLELYKQYSHEKEVLNKKAIVAMERGEMEETGVGTGEKSLKEAVISLYGVGSRGEEPILLERDRDTIDKSIDRIKTSKKRMEENPLEGENSLREAVVSLYGVGATREGQNPNIKETEIENTVKRIKSLREISELEEIRLRMEAIERISAFLAFRYLTEQLAKVEMHKYNIEKNSKINRREYITEVEHLQNLIPESSNIHNLLLMAQESFKVVEEIHIQDILHKEVEGLSKQEQLDYIRSHRDIFGRLTKKWNNARSAPPPFLPTVYQ